MLEILRSLEPKVKVVAYIAVQEREESIDLYEPATGNVWTCILTIDGAAKRKAFWAERLAAEAAWLEAMEAEHGALVKNKCCIGENIS